MIIGITTSARRESTLERSYESFKQAFHCEHLILEDHGRGCWNHWFHSLVRLRRDYPNQDYYAIFQDDVIFCKNVQSYLATLTLPKVFSIFKPKQYFKNDGVWSKQTLGGKLWMAQTYFFRHDIVDSLLHSKIVWKVSGNKQVDNRVGLWAESIGEPVYFHAPSLAQHIGDTSTLWGEDKKASGLRSANDFLGEDFDCAIKNPTSF